MLSFLRVSLVYQGGTKLLEESVPDFFTIIRAAAHSGSHDHHAPVRYDETDVIIVTGGPEHTTRCIRIFSGSVRSDAVDPPVVAIASAAVDLPALIDYDVQCSRYVIASRLLDPGPADQLTALPVPVVEK